MLFGQQLGRGHESRLVAVLQSEQHGKQGHDRLPGPHVAHEDPVHSFRRGHVGSDLTDGTLLIGGQLPGKRLRQTTGEVVPDLKGYAAPSSLCD
jgi:hypothetical protein